MEKKKNQDNLILIVCDCLRVDYAYNPDLMPFLNNFKDQNNFSKKSFSNATNTHLAMPTMMTGVHPFSKTNSSGINNKIIGTYLPKIFKINGYSTHGITANIVTSSSFGYNVDWDSWEDFWSQKRKQSGQKYIRKITDKIPQTIKNSLLSPLRKVVRRALPEQITDVKNKVRADKVFQKLKSLPIKQNGNFIFLHLMEPHSPYGTVEDVRKFGISNIKALTGKIYDNPSALSFKDILKIRNLYRNECRYLDKILKEMITYLLEILDVKSTRIIITADHGEALGETEYFMHQSDMVSNRNHIQIPFITKNIPLESDRTYWTEDIYNFLIPSDKYKGIAEPYCVGYKKVSLSLPGIRSE
jgi:arylsulfatase